MLDFGFYNMDCMDGMKELKKRSQAERLTIAETLTDSVWEEFTHGSIERDLLQIAVYVQTNVNRIVWKLNQRMNNTSQGWLYEEDNGAVMAKCPECEGRMIISLYQYNNPYHYCPYCGVPLEEGKLKQKRKKVYGDER